MRLLNSGTNAEQSSHLQRTAQEQPRKFYAIVLSVPDVAPLGSWLNVNSWCMAICVNVDFIKNSCVCCYLFLCYLTLMHKINR